MEIIRAISEAVSRFIIDQSFIGQRYQAENNARLSDLVHRGW